MSQITELRLSGWMRISAARIRPDGSMVVLEGPNGAGKSSVLDAIFTALRGRDAAPSKPINKEADEASIHLDIGDFVIRRSFKRSPDGASYTDSLKLTNAEGTPVQKPQSVLNALLGDLTFDPLNFLERKPKEQFDLLKRLVPGIDFDENDKARKEAFDTRTDVKRRAHAARIKAEGIKLPPGTKPEPVDVRAVMKELERVQEENGLNHQRKMRREQAERDADELEAEAEELRARASDMEAKAAALRKQIAEAAPLPEPEDPEPLRVKLAAAQEIDRAIALFAAQETAEREATYLEAQATGLTAGIEALDKAKAAAIASANLPVPGLSLGDGEVLLDDLPLSQAMTAMQIRTAVAIAGALNPGLRVILIREGSFLDKKSLAALGEFAKEQDLQIWLEKVADAKGAGIWIEDGEVNQ